MFTPLSIGGLGVNNLSYEYGFGSVAYQAVAACHVASLLVSTVPVDVLTAANKNPDGPVPFAKLTPNW